MATVAHNEILAVEGVRIPGRTGVPSQMTLDLNVAAGQIAFVEVSEPIRSAYFVDVCLGLDRPAVGQVRLLGIDWCDLQAGEAMRHREQVGTLLWHGNWLDHLPVMDNIVLASAHHGTRSSEQITAEALRLARRFGLPGLPAGRPPELSRDELMRAACVKAFLGEPMLVLIEDPTVAAARAIQHALAAEFINVQNRGGAVVCCVASLAADVCGMLGTCDWMRLGDRGLGPARRPHERLASLRQ